MEVRHASFSPVAAAALSTIAATSTVCAGGALGAAVGEAARLRRSMTENRAHNASKDTHDIPSTLFATKLLLRYRGTSMRPTEIISCFDEGGLSLTHYTGSDV